MINFLNDERFRQPWWKTFKNRFLSWMEHVPSPRIEVIAAEVAIALSALSLIGTFIAAPVPVCAGVAIAFVFS